MKKHKLTKFEKIDVVLVLVLVIISLVVSGYFDFNEKLGFPFSVADEPLLIIFGFILGYLVAKFRFLRRIDMLKV